MSGREVPVEIYSYPDAESFMDALKNAHSRPYWAVNNDREAYDAGALETTASMNCTITEQEGDYWSRYYLILPHTA